jgi:putative radical SAM enzyme (TIGR03279 family)
MVRVVASKDRRLPIGSTITAINGQDVDDFLEFQFYDDISKSRRLLIESNGTSRRIRYRPHQKIAVTLEPPRYRQCTNNCDFCFINGLPENLRKELYFRDDDYRLSFLFGNFLSLTNVNRSDIARIRRLRLSPLYVSVHTTDPKLRIELFKNEKAAMILKILKQLIDSDIRIHSQIVVIPGRTNGESLVRTINDLSKLYPGVQSIGIVPVGRTKYVEGIPLVPAIMAKAIIELVHTFHSRFRKKYRCGLVYLADEFYIKAGHEIPTRAYYDDMPQYENGIGMVRTMLDEINMIKRIKKTKGRHLLLTGRSAFPFMKLWKARLKPSVEIDVQAVDNSFFGRTVTVSGLLAAGDFLHQTERLDATYDRIVLPPNSVNETGEFLDSKKIDDPRIIIAPQNMTELLKCLL